MYAPTLFLAQNWSSKSMFISQMGDAHKGTKFQEYVNVQCILLIPCISKSH